MAEIELVCLLLMVVAAFDIVARKVGLPYPVLLVLSGLVLSLVPYLPHVALDPELALLVFLPPLLYRAAFLTSWRDFRRNLRPIALHAFGLVLTTTVAVAWVAHSLMPRLPWAAALILGAIVSPPDAIAATAVLQRMKIPRRIIAVLEGESLVNDSIALVAYRFGIAAVVTGSFSLPAAMIELPVVGLGGVFVGFVAGMAVHWIQRRLDDPPVQITITLLTPFAAYLPAEQLGVSGVLAVVTAGLYIGWRSPLTLAPRTRLEAVAFWGIVVFLLNGIIFILIGLQLPDVVGELYTESWFALLLYAAAVSTDRRSHSNSLGLPGGLFAALAEQETPSARPVSRLATPHDHRVVWHARCRVSRRRPRAPTFHCRRRAIPRAKRNHFSLVLRHSRDTRPPGPHASFPGARPGSCR